MTRFLRGFETLTSHTQVVANAGVLEVKVARGAFVPAGVLPADRAKVEESVAGLRNRRVAVVLLPERRRRRIRVDVTLERNFDALPQRVAKAGRPRDGKRRSVCGGG